MAIKKSELYSSIWASCDELRGGMDASQYKDYVLVLLFIKYVSDKYGGQKKQLIKIPDGGSFKDMVALKGDKDIGNKMNIIIAALAKENGLKGVIDLTDFNDPDKLGKSKGQFYTPAEVSRIIAQIVGIREAKTSADTSVYDPTCGSGSLLLKVGDEAGTPVTLYGQEKDAATSGLARMNMILHNNPTALITQGNTLTDPKYKVGEALKTFDYVVANPPFSDKRWSTGLDPLHDPFDRFQSFGVPPARQGDYAYLLHIVRSVKSMGKGACSQPTQSCRQGCMHGEKDPIYVHPFPYGCTCVGLARNSPSLSG